MKLVHTLAAAGDREAATWAIADGLVQDFGDAGIDPTPLHFKEAAEALTDAGFDYEQSTVTEFWRVASVFTSSRRRKRVSLFVYREICRPLWMRVSAETRSNDLVGYAAEYLASDSKFSGRKASVWAKAKGEELDAVRIAEQKAKAEEALREKLAGAEAKMSKAIAADDLDKAREVLVEVNEIRRKLGMDLLKLAEPEAEGEEATTETDEEATEEAEKESEAEKTARLNLEAKTAIEYALARVSDATAFLANRFLQVEEDLTLDDRDAYAEEIELIEGRLALIRAQLNGTASDEALAAALAEWGQAA